MLAYVLILHMNEKKTKICNKIQKSVDKEKEQEYINTQELLKIHT
jgi:hypothetical protein